MSFSGTIMTGIRMVSVAFTISVCSTFGAEKVNLVPEKAATSPNYWCTWYAQNYWINRGTDMKKLVGVTNGAAREELNEHTLFNEKDGWATTYLPNSREDYIFLIDHGWQSKRKDEFVGGGVHFFNLITDPRDFPRYAGMHPKDALKKFNEDIKALGWRELGIWTRGNVTKEEAETFVKWSKHAGIKYWKIDGGDTAEFYCTQAKEVLFPELILEYVTGAGGNINPRWNKNQSAYPSIYEIGHSLQKPMLKCLQYSDTFRTYDASPLLMSATTLRRTHDILKQTQQQPKYRAILNIQDDCNTAVGLGVLVASKRHPNVNERLLQGKDLHHQLSGPRCMQKRINEVDRLAKWSRIAPAFPAGVGTYLSSSKELIDKCMFTKWDTWASQTYGKMVTQSAPAIMARNMPLPIVEAKGVKPFVCTTTYPNGPTGIAVEGRVTPENRWLEPTAKVTVQIKDAGQPIGVVGNYDELVLKFAGSIENVKTIWAQDLLADQAKDIIEDVTIKDNTLTIPGTLIKKIGLEAADKGDKSVPGMVLKLVGTNLPVAGPEYTPVVKPATTAKAIKINKSKSVDGFAGIANITKVKGGYKLEATSEGEITLRKLKQNITSGKVSVTWEMEAASPKTKNGFLVLSSDDDGLTALCAGAWIGGEKMALFQNSSNWYGLNTKEVKMDKVLKCQLDVNLDLRTAVLTINGNKMQIAFSEVFTTINYIGFGATKASTYFTKPVIKVTK